MVDALPPCVAGSMRTNKFLSSGPKIVSCFKCITALPGRVPPRNATTHAGVLSFNLWRFCEVFFRYFSIIVISELLSTREAMPERRTGVAYISLTRRDAAGFPCCPLARPSGRTAARAF